MDFSGLNNNPTVFDTSSNRREDPEIEVRCPNHAQLWRVRTRGAARRAKTGGITAFDHFPPLQNDDSVRDPVDAMEVFDLIRDIKDPEHEDLSLESLNVLQVRACWLP